VAWQAITASAGSFALVCALAAPVDLWRLTVKSRQGEPFRATATLASLPAEHISTECLSMGPESDAPGSEAPFLDKANLKLDAAGSKVEISTDEPIGVPALALVLRVQCAGAPLYARHFTALIPPPLARAQDRVAEARPAKRRGFRLSLLRGDTVESVAAVIFPASRSMQRDLVKQVVAGNPNVFSDGRIREVSVGTVLWFPDLREIRRSSREKPSPAARTAGVGRPGKTAMPASSESAPAEVIEEVPAKPHKPITLRRALALGDKPGPQECKQLMQLCGAEAPVVAAISPALDAKASALESGVNELHLKQDSIDRQLQRLERSLQALQMAVNSAPLQSAQPAPSPPKVEIRTVVKSEPIDWTIWLGFAGLVIASAAAGFVFGRRGSFSRGLAKTDEQLDRMLATAATVMRELESTPRVDEPMPPPAPRLPPAASAPAVTDQPADESPSDTAAKGEGVSEVAPETQAMLQTTDVDVRLESEPAAKPDIAGLSTDVLYEMDQALDNTRSMFTDVDRFIALGRTQNALSLLQFQVHRDPKDRDSWIKLMAIYRQEKMDAELARAVREFRGHFPLENPPGGVMLG
jgi:hypothetical protein